MDYFDLADIKISTNVQIVNSNLSPNILEQFNVKCLNSQQSLAFVLSPASGVFNLTENPANIQGENQSNWVCGANSSNRELINSDLINNITPDMVPELGDFERALRHEESHASQEDNSNERPFYWIAHGSPVTGNVCHASNAQAMSRFREWLSTAHRTESNSPDDLAFETWPVERLAAELDRYFDEMRTRDGPREAPASGIRAALALHLLKAHASVQGCAVDLSPVSLNAASINKPSGSSCSRARAGFHSSSQNDQFINGNSSMSSNPTSQEPARKRQLTPIADDDSVDIKPQLAKRWKSNTNSESLTSASSAEHIGLALSREHSGTVIAAAQAEQQSAQARSRPVQSSLRPELSAHLSHFRQWLSSKEQTLCPPGRRRGACDRDVAFETWPVERLAAVLERYYSEARTRHGRHYAPSSLQRIRFALFHHLKKAHADGLRGAIDLVADPAFDAANRAFIRAIKNYNLSGSSKKAKKKRSSTAPIYDEAKFSLPLVDPSSNKSSCSHTTGNVNSKASCGISEKDVSSDDDYSSAFTNPRLQVPKKRKSTALPDNDIKAQLAKRMKSSMNSEPLISAPNASLVGPLAPRCEHIADAVAPSRAEQQSAQASGPAVQRTLSLSYKLYVSRFRQWLTSLEQTQRPPGRSSDASARDVAFETWPVERLAAALERYYEEARTQSGRRYAPSTLQLIRNALVSHLNINHRRRSFNPAFDPAFDAANRAFNRAVQSYTA